ncbi:hypothetical protein B0H13DRAFT_1899656 [Mycena leptocephala]|nr:hypothetical protein B0H13DRAFT_1899656 [Mycena leptocephala]
MTYPNLLFWYLASRQLRPRIPVPAPPVLSGFSFRPILKFQSRYQDSLLKDQKSAWNDGTIVDDGARRKEERKSMQGTERKGNSSKKRLGFDGEGSEGRSGGELYGKSKMERKEGMSRLLRRKRAAMKDSGRNQRKQGWAGNEGTGREKEKNNSSSVILHNLRRRLATEPIIGHDAHDALAEARRVERIMAVLIVDEGMRGRAKDGIEKQSNDKGLGEGEEPTRICTGTNPRGPVLLAPVLGAREPRRENGESLSRACAARRDASVNATRWHGG